MNGKLYDDRKLEYGRLEKMEDLIVGQNKRGLTMAQIGPDGTPHIISDKSLPVLRVDRLSRNMARVTYEGGETINLIITGEMIGVLPITGGR